MVNIHLYIPEAQQVPNRINSKRSTIRYIIVKIVKAKNKEKNLDNSKRKMTHHIQGNPSKSNSCLPPRNNEGQIAVLGHVQNAKGKLSTKNLSVSKTIFQKKEVK